MSYFCAHNNQPAALCFPAQVYEDVLAVPVIKGKKTELEKFAGFSNVIFCSIINSSAHIGSNLLPNAWFVDQAVCTQPLWRPSSLPWVERCRVSTQFKQ